MNKAELIEKLSTSIQVSKAQSELILDGLLDIIQKTVAKGEEVKLVGFGTFGAATRKARAGRNPKTGSKITIPRSRVPKFKPGKEFKSKVAR